MLFFFLCIDILIIVLQLLDVVLNLCVIKNFIVASCLIKHRSSLIVYFVSFSFLSLMCIYHVYKTYAILEIDLVSFKVIDRKKSAMNKNETSCKILTSANLNLTSLKQHYQLLILLYFNQSYLNRKR